MMNKHALIITPKWLGDVIMSIPLIMELDRRYECVHCIAPEYLKELLTRIPINSKVYSNPSTKGLGLMRKWQLAKVLKKFPIHESVVIQKSFKSALIPWFASIPKRVGWLGELRYGLINHIRPLDKSKGFIERFSSLIGQLDPKDLIPKLQVDLNSQKKENI